MHWYRGSWCCLESRFAFAALATLSASPESIHKNMNMLCYTVLQTSAACWHKTTL